MSMKVTEEQYLLLEAYSVDELKRAINFQHKVESTELIPIYIVFAEGREMYDEQDTIDSIFLNEKECKEYVKRENEDSRSSYHHYYDEWKIKNPFRPEIIKVLADTIQKGSTK